MAKQSRLEQLGYNPQYVSAEQRSVIDGLTDDELNLLLKIKNRLDEAGEVEGHNMDGGGVVW
jgi:hypothetical protein